MDPRWHPSPLGGLAGKKPNAPNLAMDSPSTTASGWIDEHHQGVRYGLQGRVLVDEKSPYQRITVIDSSRYGKGLLLDG